MTKVLKVAGGIFFFALLTFFTQVGGLVYLLWLFLAARFKDKFAEGFQRLAFHVLGFSGFYMLFNLVIIPLLAAPFDRVQLPRSKSGNLAPVSYWTCIFNRHYITREGEAALLELSDSFAAENPGLKVQYMDCNFPFRFISTLKGNNDGVPFVEGLFPHFSHVGNKADISLIYKDKSGKVTEEKPTAFAYGSSVDPLPGETCTPCKCDRKNSFYSFMYRNFPKNADLELDVEHSSKLLKHFLESRHVRYTLLEKHLRQRFGLMRYHFGSHGCGSVRHDDHFHVELH